MGKKPATQNVTVTAQPKPKADAKPKPKADPKAKPKAEPKAKADAKPKAAVVEPAVPEPQSASAKKNAKKKGQELPPAPVVPEPVEEPEDKKKKSRRGGMKKKDEIVHSATHAETAAAEDSQLNMFSGRVEKMLSAKFKGDLREDAPKLILEIDTDLRTRKAALPRGAGIIPSEAIAANMAELSANDPGRKELQQAYEAACEAEVYNIVKAKMALLRQRLYEAVEALPKVPTKPLYASGPAKSADDEAAEAARSAERRADNVKNRFAKTLDKVIEDTSLPNKTLELNKDVLTQMYASPFNLFSILERDLNVILEAVRPKSAKGSGKGQPLPAPEKVCVWATDKKELDAAVAFLQKLDLSGSRTREVDQRMLGKPGKVKELEDQFHVYINKRGTSMTVLGTKANVEKVFDAAEAALKEEGVESRAVVDIESSKGQCVIGQVGAWRESYKSLTIRPMGRADKGENIKVVITGKDERAVNQAKAKINDFVQALVAVNLEGSAEAVQKLIKGRNALSRQYVELRNATREVHMDPKESSIALVGPRKNVFDIKSKVQELMTKAALEPVEIRVEESQKRIFSNTALKEMSEQTGAEISRDNAKCCLVIIGDTGAIEKAQAAIQELIDNNGAQESLPTTNASVRALLGKPDKSLDARNKINECEAKYSVAIDLVKVEQKVNILGSKENVAKAKADLESFMASADKAEADMTKKEVDIADDDAPRIIGKQGSTIRSIRDECGVQASLDKDTKKMEIKGSAENVEKALEMIKRILTREPREPREDKGKGKGRGKSEDAWEPREDKGRGKGRGRVLEAADGSSRSCFATEKPERAEKPKAPKREAYKHDEELFPSLAGPSSKTKSKNSEE